MTEDIFDIVDEHDRVIGAAPRSEVHARGLLHRAVHIFLFNSRDEILLQLRSPNKDRHPNTWDSSACGHVDSGESYDTAAVRETREELGLDPVPALEQIGSFTPCAATGNEFVRLYRATHDGPFQPCPREIAGLRWISPAALSAWIHREPAAFAPALVLLWRATQGSSYKPET